MSCSPRRSRKDRSTNCRGGERSVFLNRRKRRWGWGRESAGVAATRGGKTWLLLEDDILPHAGEATSRHHARVLQARPTRKFCWTRGGDAECTGRALAGLADCVTRLGHSSSLPGVPVTDPPGEITFGAAEAGDRLFRAPAGGRLKELARDSARQAR